jgi:acylphosphatase
MTERELLHARVAGRVQGVGFRWFVREEARRLGLAGWVRNLPSGEVEVLADGDTAAIESLAEALSKGPPGARVEIVHKLPVSNPDEPLPSPFAIQR